MKVDLETREVYLGELHFLFNSVPVVAACVGGRYAWLGGQNKTGSDELATFACTTIDKIA